MKYCERYFGYVSCIGFLNKGLDGKEIVNDNKSEFLNYYNSLKDKNYSNFENSNVHDFFSKLLGSYLYNKGLRTSLKKFNDKKELEKEMNNSFSKDNTSLQCYNPRTLLGCMYSVIENKNKIVKMSNSELKDYYDSLIYIFTDNIAELYFHSRELGEEFLTVKDIFNNIFEIDSNEENSNDIYISDIIRNILLNITSINLPVVKRIQNGIDPIEKMEILSNLNTYFLNVINAIEKIVKDNDFIVNQTLYKGFIDNEYKISENDLMKTIDHQNKLYRLILVTYITLYAYVIIKKQ